MDVDVTVQGPLPGSADYARRKIGSLAKFTHGPVAYARVRLTNRTHRWLPRPVVAQANLEINGRRVRAQVEASTASEAIDALQDRLRRILERQSRHRPPRGKFRHVVGEHHGQPTEPRWPTDSAAGEARRIIRHKSFGVARLSVEEAAEELDLLDHHFYLFTEKSTGRDSVLYRSGPTGYRLAQTKSAAQERVTQPHDPVTVSPAAPPELTVAQAVERLNLVGLPFLFFVDVAQGRGSVLYLRYDGQYGLITPAA